jgi:hypothetical protein
VDKNDVRAYQKIDPRAVVGTLKSLGTRDPDVLYAEKLKMLAMPHHLTKVGMWLMITGGLLTILIITAFIGIPAIVGGWWMRRRGTHNAAAIEEGFRLFEASAAAG